MRTRDLLACRQVCIRNGVPLPSSMEKAKKKLPKSLGACGGFYSSDQKLNKGFGRKPTIFLVILVGQNCTGTKHGMKSLTFLPALFLEPLLHLCEFSQHMYLKQAICLYFFRQAVILCKIKMWDGEARDLPDLTRNPSEYQDVCPVPG